MKPPLASIITKLSAISEKLEPYRTCPRCKGTGTRAHWDKKITELLPCNNCNGSILFHAPNFGDLAKLVLSDRTGPITLKSSTPKRDGTNLMNRAAYVWRIARFNGGLDVTMPVMAPIMLGDDPYIKELDSLADGCAKLACGTNMAGAIRWAPLLGSASSEAVDKYIEKHPQPASALPCGPVVMQGHSEELEAEEAAYLADEESLR